MILVKSAAITAGATHFSLVNWRGSRRDLLLLSNRISDIAVLREALALARREA
ncbi:MAG: hypothetical protein ACHP7E_11065 [Burkholderiales bacterium]